MSSSRIAKFAMVDVDPGLGPARDALRGASRLISSRCVPTSFGGARTFAAIVPVRESTAQLDCPSVHADDAARHPRVKPRRFEHQVRAERLSGEDRLVEGQLVGDGRDVGDECRKVVPVVRLV